MEENIPISTIQGSIVLNGGRDDIGHWSWVMKPTMVFRSE